GDLGRTEGFLIEELYHHRADVDRMTRNAFYRLSDYQSEAELEEDILALSEPIERALHAFVEERGIDVLVPNNIWSLGANPPAAVAFARVVRKLRISAVAHHHDFHWERIRGMDPTCEAAAWITQEYLPPKDPLITHVVINSFAQQELLKRKGIAATVVPNVFDFGGPSWEIDEYNRGFREDIGVGASDILVLQATRIVERKGIELAIDLVVELNKPSYLERLRKAGLYDGRRFTKDDRIVLVLAGYSEDRREDYLNRLKQKAERAGIEVRIITDSVRSQRGEIDGRRFFSLWDCYVFADIVTYPSLYEGWGNQFLEAIRAKLPIVLFEYPVYKADIKQKGFNIISLEDKVKARDDLGLVTISKTAIRKAAQRSVEVLTDSSAREGMVDHNFSLGKEFYSLENLGNRLEKLLTYPLGKRKPTT
ncbi:glycosyltransferase family 4 protein, partial [Candidatus Bipolaricaulota bacterium]|nr:glycosyltransferase family 4 protein [Candidatus Bipolaricaulota bacterium]